MLCFSAVAQSSHIRTQANETQKTTHQKRPIRYSLQNRRRERNSPETPCKVHIDVLIQTVWSGPSYMMAVCPLAAQRDETSKACWSGEMGGEATGQLGY